MKFFKTKAFLFIFSLAFSNISFAKKKRNYKVIHKKGGSSGQLWKYSGEFGPNKWSKIHDDFSECRKGEKQSPINISGVTEGENKPLVFKYRPSNLKVINNGFTLHVPYDKGSTVVFNEEAYSLKNIQFHSPSEHRIHGQQFPMEIELIHENGSNDKVIISVFIEKGKWNNAIYQIFQDAPKNYGEKRYFPDERLKAAELLPKNKEYYLYEGSLSQPPCTEDVKRVVLRNSIYAGKGQLKMFKKYYKNNVRDVQSLNGRKVTY